MVTEYFLPKPLEYLLKTEAAQWVNSREAVALDHNVPWPGYVVYGTKRALWHFIENAPIKGRLTAGMDFEKFLKFAGIPDLKGLTVFENTRFSCEGKVMPLLADRGEPVWDLDHSLLSSMYNHPSFVPNAKGVLHELSLVSGFSFKVFVMDGETLPPPPYVEREWNVVISGGPPGCTYSSKYASLAGVHLDHPKRMCCPDPVPGLGPIIEDGEGQVIAQIVENTIYVLTPFREKYAEPITRHDGVLDRTLRICFEQMYKGLPKMNRARLSSAHNYQQFVRKRQDLFIERAKDELGELDEQIVRKRRQLQELMRDQQDLRRTLKALKMPSEAEQIEDLSSWKDISKDKRVTEVVTVDGHVHVHTTEVIIEHENVRYNLGEFVIRIGVDGTIVVYGRKNRHKERISSHPHISDRGVPCFGNMSDALQEAIAEARIADAISMLVDWLFDGYDDEHTITPITDWKAMKEPD